ncbi:unnamed protein product (macronuclear) [Paramecium tetraurelia]|uniref:Uncharacterized protein n=1 Tax=Paramecium tetraurelia TaxID=5888 RepID=A0DNV6_PARTE|nr:uncharacterized protein GSPATT00018919001 [Paramecium tetraurelia]CAK84723.1 unnamed protein product [Paramecium tetraurelia]|eukprot:XP_001452120.1 hypothetical protein (macronuclear) [Paramecium tetraurelia strain d4-2]
MKILVITCLMVLTLSNPLEKIQKINVPCIEEIGYLTKDLFVFGLDIARHKFCNQVKDVIGIIVEIVKLKNACSSSSSQDIMEEHNKTLACLQNSLDIAEDAYNAYNAFIQKGFSDELFDQTTNIQQQLVSTLSRCSSKAKLLEDIFPTHCISVMNNFARDALFIKEQRHQPWKIIDGLASMGENYQVAKQHCPFMK